MPKKEEPEFTVTDRRKFTSEGELRDETETPRQDVPEPGPRPEAAGPVPLPPPAEEMPAAPTAAEQQAQHDAFKASAKQMDARIEKELGGRKPPQNLDMTLERFVASLYMTALLQLGLMHEQGEHPQVDLIGARQTIDTMGILAEKTKGNLSMNEQNLLQNSLYELRMAYVEVTNALARGPQPSAPSPGFNSK